jgi:hypothetical protein
VVFGATVDLEDETSGAKVTYQIVGDDEADLKLGLISISSPIARALIGKHAGDVAEVQAPGGASTGKSWTSATAEHHRADRVDAVAAGPLAGWLLCVALLATPAPFALLERADAGRVVARMLAQEAYASLALGVCCWCWSACAARARPKPGRAQFSPGMVLALGAVFCTVAGYFGVQPMMAAARLGQGALSFGQLHAISAAFFAVKLVLVACWPGAGCRTGGYSAPSS